MSEYLTYAQAISSAQAYERKLFAAVDTANAERYYRHMEWYYRAARYIASGENVRPIEQDESWRLVTGLGFWLEALAVYARHVCGENVFTYPRDYFKSKSVLVGTVQTQWAEVVAIMGEHMAVEWYLDYTRRDVNGYDCDAPDELDIIDALGFPDFGNWRDNPELGVRLYEKVKG